MTGHNVRLHPALVQVGAKPKAQRLDAVQVDFLLEQPARVVFAKAGRLDQRQALIVRRVGNEIGARFGKHGHCLPVSVGWRNPPAAAAPAGLVARQVCQPLRQLEHDHITLCGRVRHPARNFVTRPAASDAEA
jgi:hypothetical protein